MPGTPCEGLALAGGGVGQGGESAGVGKLISLADAAVEEEGGGHKVGGIEAGDGDGDDGVVDDGRADVDEADEAGDDTGNGDGPDGNVGTLVNLGN